MWELFNDIDDPGRMVECFMVESWIEHLRQHEQVTVADRDVIEKTRAFHLGSDLTQGDSLGRRKELADRGETSSLPASQYCHRSDGFWHMVIKKLAFIFAIPPSLNLIPDCFLVWTCFLNGVK